MSILEGGVVKVSHSTQTAIFQLVDCAYAAAQVWGAVGDASTRLFDHANHLPSLHDTKTKLLLSTQM